MYDKAFCIHIAANCYGFSVICYGESHILRRYGQALKFYGQDYGEMSFKKFQISQLEPELWRFGEVSLWKWNLRQNKELQVLLLPMDMYQFTMLNANWIWMLKSGYINSKL